MNTLFPSKKIAKREVKVASEEKKKRQKLFKEISVISETKTLCIITNTDKTIGA